MQTFNTRCTELRAQIGRIQTADADKQLVRTMDDILTELGTHLERTFLLEKTVKVFADVKKLPKIAFDANAVAGLKTKINALVTKIDKNRSKINENSGWAECGVRAKSLADTLEKDLRKIWIDYITGERPGFEMFLGFRGLPQCKTPIQELERLANTLNELGRTLPENPDPIEMVTTIADQMRKIIASLGLDGQPAEMVAFLKKCSTEGGAPLSELTQEIFKWIQEQGFAGDLRVKSR